MEADQGGDFAVPAADGWCVDAVTEIEDRGKPVRILVVRTFRSDDMRVREAAAEMVVDADR
jgi:hypothetical protein